MNLGSICRQIKIKPAGSLRKLALIGLIVATMTGSAISQAPANRHPDIFTTGILTDVAKLFAKHFPDKKTLRASAEQVARKYREQLKGIGGKVSWLESEAGDKFSQLGWREKLNLAGELWKVRSSVDLLCLLSPEVLKELTGLDVQALVRWTNTLTTLEGKLKNSLPFGIRV